MIVSSPGAEASASRLYASIFYRLPKVMWSADNDTAVESSGDDRLVQLCSDLALTILRVCAASEGAPPAIEAAPPIVEEVEPAAESSPPVVTEVAYWIVGTMAGNAPQVKAYDSEDVAQRLFNSEARRTAAVLMTEPGNHVIDSYGDDGEVEAVRKSAAATTAGAVYVVAASVGFTEATIHASAAAAAAGAQANGAYAVISSRFAKVLFRAGSDTAVKTFGVAKWVEICDALARAILVAAAAGSTAAPPDVESVPTETTPPAESPAPVDAGAAY